MTGAPSAGSIAIVDYGVGNLGSIRNMLQRLGIDAHIVSDPDRVRYANKLILPGVGAFGHGMTRLMERGMIDALHDRSVRGGVPTLGICLGFQLLTAGSEEGGPPGLGWLSASTVGFQRHRLESYLRVPHMGWADVRPVGSSKLFAGLEQDARFYFVHSYHVVPDAGHAPMATSIHGYSFAAAMQSGNVMGVQFHPEKSHRFGMQLLRNFAERY